MLVRFGDLGWNVGRDLMALGDLRREIDRLFAGDVYATGAAPGLLRRLDRVELRDEGDAFVFEAEVPGFEKDEIEVSLEEETLTVRGEQRPQEGEGEGEPRRRSRRAAQFARSFTLPARVDAEKVTATLRNGILELRLPKAVESRARQIAVRAA